MILEAFGILSTAQDLTAGTTDSENVIDLGAIDLPGMESPWLVVDVETIATGDAADTFEFKLVVATEATLDTIKEVVKVVITGYADSRLATAGNHILAVNLGEMLQDIATSSYRYLGLMSVISAGATVSINAAVSPSKPRTRDNVQVVRSNVGVPSSGV